MISCQKLSSGLSKKAQPAPAEFTKAIGDYVADLLPHYTVLSTLGTGTIQIGVHFGTPEYKLKSIIYCYAHQLEAGFQGQVIYYEDPECLDRLKEALNAELHYLWES